MKTASLSIIALLLASLLLASLPQALFAASNDKKLPIQVEADSLEVRDSDNISIYSGNVRLAQGSLLIQSDRLVIHFSDEKDLVLMEMTGKPATFRQLDDEQNEMLGQADKLDYHEAESLLVLQGNARFSNKGDTIESSSIRINTETDYIEAASTEPDERVRMVIQPKHKSSEQEESDIE